MIYDLSQNRMANTSLALCSQIDKATCQTSFSSMDYISPKSEVTERRQENGYYPTQIYKSLLGMQTQFVLNPDL